MVKIENFFPKRSRKFLGLYWHHKELVQKELLVPIRRNLRLSILSSTRLIFLVKFDIVRAQEEATIIRYFWKNFKHSIKVEIKQTDQVLISFKKTIQRAINVKAKASLRSNIIVWDLDAHCPRGHRLSYTILVKVQTQRFIAKEFKPKESKPKNSKSTKSKTFASPYSKLIELGKTSHIDKKKEYLKR